ncbi:right-handed parallel beta-helix repeat-containing protein [Aquimarina sediminis]|uniref:right-handed parallel beta-helix repeat-containing protein n=1 Tax=Aquimarina sediminis TaxID=2070536 RepID=UPI000CA07619|nr:right-handed parallel beta-helix repeat-containing protein [Aquimarina sediminis]
MKNLFYYLLASMICITASCTKEIIQEAPPESRNQNTDHDECPNIVTTPCDFDLSNVVANSTIVLNCILDLKGETITLPNNVDFEFEGGDIKNGTLVFSSGTIDGRLLSSNLNIEGNAQLKDTTFDFYPSRWEGIEEGPTTSDTALKNNQELERLFFFIKELGGTTFKIDKFDAYFEVTKITPPNVYVFHTSKESVNIPSNFNLEMTDNTHLRAFPAEAGKMNGAILAVRDVENVTASGGTLHGDRLQRQYSANNGQEGSHLFHIHSGRNITLDGMTFIEGSKGGIAIYSFGFSFNPNTYKPTTGVTIKNCTFKDNRRMSIAFTDGRDVTIKNNTFINTGHPMGNSNGGEVGYAINIEATRRRDPVTGELQEYEKAFDIDISNNTEINSRGGSVSVTIGQDVTVENNTFDTQLVFTHTSGTKIINNTFNATSAGAQERFAIFAANGGETAFNNEISGNTINGYTIGVATNADDTNITENIINDCGIGLQIGRSTNSEINDNIINVTGNGISATNSFVNNVSLKGNEVTAGRFHVYFAQLNDKPEYENYRLTLEGNKFLNTKKVSFSNATGVTFKNNEVIGGLEIGNAKHIKISSNTKIKPDQSDGIRLYGSHTSVSITNNTITEPTGAARYVCLNNNSNTPNAITDTGNTCN